MHRRSILILPFHGIGHFNGLFGIARALQKTHHVVFAGTGYFHSHVASQGFPFRILSSFPFGVGLEGWIHKIRKSSSPIFRNIVDRWRDTVYHERLAELTRVLAELKPVHVLVDAQQATDVIVLKTIDPSLRVSVINIPPPYLLIPGLPPVNSLALPGDTKAIDKAYRESLRRIRDKQWRQRIKYFVGLDDRSIVQRRVRKNKMMHLKADYPSLITFAVKGIDQYVLTYSEYDFRDDRLGDLRYVGPHIDPDVEEKRMDEFRPLLESMRSTGKKVVYCSFGTVDTEKNIKSFIARVSNAAVQMDIIVIISAKNAGEYDSPNVKIFNWVPQRLVLAHCDLFITHGGINSVHDAIQAGVPMIVYPIENGYDQNGNSSRVIHHGLGLRGDFDNDTTDEMKRKMSEIFDDIRFRKNIQTLREKTSYYTTDNFVKMLLS
jgi:zeaxanthin glucosyltransferase